LLVIEVLERSLDEDRCLCGKMREEERILVYYGLGVAHGCANIGTGRASFCEFVLVVVQCGTTLPL